MLNKKEYTKDTQLNKLIEEVLAEDDTLSLSADFTNQLAKKAMGALNYRKKLKGLFVYFGILFTITIIPLVLISVFNLNILLSYKEILFQYKWIILFSLFVLTGIQTADYLLIKKQENIIFE